MLNLFVLFWVISGGFLIIFWWNSRSLIQMYQSFLDIYNDSVAKNNGDAAVKNFVNSVTMRIHWFRNKRSGYRHSITGYTLIFILFATVFIANFGMGLINYHALYLYLGVIVPWLVVSAYVVRCWIEIQEQQHNLSFNLQAAKLITN